LNPRDLTLLPDLGVHDALAEAGLADALAAASTPSAPPAHGCLAAATRLLAASAPRWRPRLGATPAGTRRTRLAWTATTELWLVEWAPGAATRAHDHHGAAVALTVLDGALVEDCLDATIWTTCRRTTFQAGSTTAFDPGHVHLLTAATRAASVHALSSPAQPCLAGTTRTGTARVGYLLSSPVKASAGPAATGQGNTAS
jgi:quercetin dioxygenase-like cupin family protein